MKGTNYPIIDAHLDIAWNALSFNRDQQLSLEALKASEVGLTDHPGRGRMTVSFPELREAGAPVVVATLLARGGRDAPASPPVKRTDLDFASPAIAHAQAVGQLAYYELLERMGELRILKTSAALRQHWQAWADGDAGGVVGVILSMEGTDPISDPDELDLWWTRGLRAAGLAHYGRSQHACGTGTTGPLTPAGRALLDAFEAKGVILDVTHLCDQSMAEALERYAGPVWASHHNCRALVPGERQLNDAQIKRLFARKAVIGVAFDAWMLLPGWKRGVSQRTDVSLNHVADQIDHLCQLAGNGRQVGLGTDLDGGFGTEQTPQELSSYRDIQRLADLLLGRGYTENDVAAIFAGNLLEFLLAALPGAGRQAPPDPATP